MFALLVGAVAGLIARLGERTRTRRWRGLGPRSAARSRSPLPWWRWR
ncbi:hypothetical protein NKH77_39740 [Streptomyces sp. M19]